MISTLSLLIIFIILIILIILFLISYWFNGPKTCLNKDLSGKIILITGGSNGIGWEITKELLYNKAKVIILSKDKFKGIEKINSLKLKYRKHCSFAKVDLRDYFSILNFVKEFKEKIGFVDILINNAGSCFNNFKLINGIEETFLNNFIGHFILTSLLIDSFNPKGIIINITSSNYKLITKKIFNNFIATNNLNFEQTKNNYNPIEIYNISKLSNIYHSIYLNDYFIKKGFEIKSISVHPGFVNNNFFRKINNSSLYYYIKYILQYPIRLLFYKSEFMGAQTCLNCCYNDYEELINGGYYKDCHFEKLGKIANLNNSKKIMEFTKSIIIKNNFVKNNFEILKMFN